MTDSSTEWLHPYYDTFNTGFCPQKEITPDNIGRLEVVWSCEISESTLKLGKEQEAYLSTVARVGVQTTPLVTRGIVYVADGYNNVYAIDADKGTKRWTFDPEVSIVRGHSLVHTLNHRDGVIYMQAADTTVFGLDANNGDVVRKISKIGSKVPGSVGKYSGRAAPSFFKECGIMGLSTQGIGEGGYEASSRGFVASYDLGKGKLRWRWFAVPPAKTGTKRWHTEASKGNIDPYPRDWGTSDRVGGGGVWGTIAIDEDSERAYFGTGNSDLFVYADLEVPGPNLYTDCLVSLDANTGRMLWYYQATPHDNLGWDIGWNTILADVVVDGTRRRAVIAGSKNNHVYVLDAKTGKPLYTPIRIGYNRTTLNANKDNAANLTGTLRPGSYSPGHLGGINAPLAFAYNTIFVTTQRVDQDATYYATTLMGKRVKGVRLKNADAPQYSTLYAIDAGRGEVKWTYFMSETCQSASITVTAGMVAVVDRGATLHILDARTGLPLKVLRLGGYGRAGAAIGRTSTGETRMFVPVSGREGKPNRVVCLGIMR